MAGKSKKKQHQQHTNGTVVTASDIESESPLKLFGQAKDQINSIFAKIDQNVSQAEKFFSEDNKLDAHILEARDIDRLKEFSKSISSIKTILSRNQMKVAFFGRTSNGKSTVINAILHDKVLPMGYGHTTGCFLQIQGDQDNEAFLEVCKDDHGDEKKPIHSVKHIANALQSGSLEHSALVKIYWPISKCSLLKYDVVLVDSPGVDVEENLDDWIDTHCHDADVFVLVSNAESTLNIAEKNFFHKVSEKLSKPNIFILNNRWDCIADDPEQMDLVRAQHVERAIKFLSDGLKISSHDEARRRTFFVSARETLQSRSNDSKVDTSREGYKERLIEFEKFEKTFEESLSKSAVKTKFEKHARRGGDTIKDLNEILGKTQSAVSHEFNCKQAELSHCLEQCKTIDRLFYSKKRDISNQIKEITSRIQISSDEELDKEVRRLSRLVDDFECDFSPNPEKLRVYKEKLYLYVENVLSENLKSRVKKVIKEHVEPFRDQMSAVSSILSKGKQQRESQLVKPRSQIQDELFDLRIYKQCYCDFQEDLEFRFSLGLVSILRKFQGKPDANDYLSIVERFILSPPQSPTTVGSLAIGGILVRTVGWRVIVITTVAYTALYAYEYLTWTNSAKERTFKAQYVKYAKKGLQGCFPIISGQIAKSVEQKIRTSFEDLEEVVEEEKRELEEKEGILRQSIKMLTDCERFTSKLMNDNDFLMNELFAFVNSFLS